MLTIQLSNLHPALTHKFGFHVSKTKVDQEDDADAEVENTSYDRVIGDAKTADDKEENAADKVDEELELRDPAANDVVEEDAGDDDGIADNNSLPKIAHLQLGFSGDKMWISGIF